MEHAHPNNSDIIFVGLYILGDLLEPDKISQALGLQPSSFKRKSDGQISAGTDKSYHQKTSVWSYVLKKHGICISQCLLEFSESLKNRSKAILDIDNVESAYIDILFSLISKKAKNDAYEFQLEAEGIQFLSSLGLPVQWKVMFSED